MAQLIRVLTRSNAISQRAAYALFVFRASEQLSFGPRQPKLARSDVAKLAAQSRSGPLTLQSLICPWSGAPDERCCVNQPYNAVHTSLMSLFSCALQSDAFQSHNPPLKAVRKVCVRSRSCKHVSLGRAKSISADVMDRSTF
jgi:hypothetical protein